MSKIYTHSTIHDLVEILEHTFSLTGFYQDKVPVIYNHVTPPASGNSGDFDNLSSYFLQ